MMIGYVANRSIVGVFWRLFESLVGDHVVFDGSEEMFKSGCFLPVFEECEVVDSSIALVDAGEVALIIEFEDGRVLGVGRSALNIQAVDPVFEVGLSEGKCTL